MNGDVSKPGGVSKHMSISNAMDEHRRALERMLSLVEKVTGLASDKSEVEKNPELSLTEFLNMGEEKVKVMTETLVKQTATLEEILF